MQFKPLKLFIECLWIFKIELFTNRPPKHCL